MPACSLPRPGSAELRREGNDRGSSCPSQAAGPISTRILGAQPCKTRHHQMWETQRRPVMVGPVQSLATARVQAHDHLSNSPYTPDLRGFIAYLEAEHPEHVVRDQARRSIRNSASPASWSGWSATANSRW